MTDLRHKWWVTLDKVDGSTRMIGPNYIDEIVTTGLLMTLSQADVIGATFTRSDMLNRLPKGSA